jgi:Uma2 family endonuclease
MVCPAKSKTSNYADRVDGRESMTEQYYLALERISQIKHEFFEGEIFAMEGGSFEHSLIAGNLIGALKSALKDRGCLILTSDLRIKIETTGLSTYPDVSLVCGTPKLTGENPDALLNPTLIAEVLSASTEGYDRGKKFGNYLQIPSFNTYLLVSQNSPNVEQFIKQNDIRWEYRFASGLDAVMELPALGVKLSLHEIYAGIEFPPGTLHRRDA